MPCRVALLIQDEFYLTVTCQRHGTHGAMTMWLDNKTHFAAFFCAVSQVAKKAKTLLGVFNSFCILRFFPVPQGKTQYAKRLCFYGDDYIQDEFYLMEVLNIPTQVRAKRGRKKIKDNFIRDYLLRLCAIKKRFTSLLVNRL